MRTVSCRINGREIVCEAGTTVLEAARAAGIDIPTLCYLKDINKLGTCRMCVVEITGMPRLMAACTTVVADGMEVFTESEAVVSSRRTTLDLICRRHRMDCEYCPDYTYCELHTLIRKYGLDERKYSQIYHPRNADESSASIVRDPSKCVRCRRCIATCKRQGVEAISALHRAADTTIGSVIPMSDTTCVGCAQCVKNCPTGALSIKDETDLLWRAHNEKKTIVFGIMPETARNIGKFFGEKGSRNEIGRIAVIAKKIGVDAVYDLSGIGTLAIKDACRKIRERQNKSNAAVLATACPGAIRFFKDYDELVKIETNEALFCQIVTDEYEHMGISREQLHIVFISPCAAGKQEHTCDAVLTTTELFQWMLRACVSRFTLRKIWDSAKPEDAQVLKALEGLPNHTDIKIDLESLLGQAISKVERFTDWKTPPKEPGIYILSACPGGCINGGGQFRTQGFTK